MLTYLNSESANKEEKINTYATKFTKSFFSNSFVKLNF